MTDINTDETTDNVVAIKPQRGKPGPKPKAPAPVVEAPVPPGTPFEGSHNPDKAQEFYKDKARDWHSFNLGRDDEGVLGIDGIIIELAFEAAASGGDPLVVRNLKAVVDAYLGVNA